MFIHCLLNYEFNKFINFIGINGINSLYKILLVSKRNTCFFNEATADLVDDECSHILLDNNIRCNKQIRDPNLHYQDLIKT